MRTKFLVSTLLAVFAGIISPAAQAQQSVTSAAGTLIRYSARDSRTRLYIQTGRGKRYTVSLRRDSTVAPAAEPTGVKVVGEVQGSAIVITDTYASVPGGMSYCQAGEEQFLRVISFSKNRPRETVRLKVASCLDNLELDETGIEWVPESSTLRIHWLAGPATKGAPELRTIRIGLQRKPTGKRGYARASGL